MILHIYLVFGSNTRDFMAYSIGGNTWSVLCSLPAGVYLVRLDAGDWHTEHQLVITH